jgi:3-oxoacyl-(acyl-carrier-protein) synthase
MLPAALDEPWAEALFKSSGKAKQLLLSGTARFLDAASRLEGERYSLEYARLAIDHERGLAYAEISVAQWGNLIGTGIGQLEAFAKGGIDKAVLSDIAKIIGLFWIGHGVSK